MSKKVKLYNRNKFDVGVKFINPIREQNVKAGSFTIVEEDDVYYLNTTCNLIRRGMLTLDEKETEIINNLGFADDAVKVISKTDAEIEAILRGNITKMKNELSVITEAFMKDAVYQIAKGISDELNGNKLKYLAEFCGKDIINEY